jgi:hypothetical protein
MIEVERTGFGTNEEVHPTALVEGGASFITKLLSLKPN